MKETGFFPENSAFMVMLDVFLWLQLYQPGRAQLNQAGETLILVLPLKKFCSDLFVILVYARAHYKRFSQFYWHFEILNRKTGR